MEPAVVRNEEMAVNPFFFICRTCCFVFLVFAVCWTLSKPAYSADRIGIRVGNMRVSRNVQSMVELRWKDLTRQGWDISCGAAALSTLLTYYQKKKFSEMAITLTILKNSDPALVRKRGGFSLYELKRFAKAVGFEGLGYGDMTHDDLELFDIPAILPIRIGDFDHFVVFKKRLGNHILLGDPAFGNMTLPAKRFEKMWKSRIAFYVVTSVEKEAMVKQEKMRTRRHLGPDAIEMAIPKPQYAGRLLHRIPIVPITRRMMSVSP